jgi:predicted permease
MGDFSISNWCSDERYLPIDLSGSEIAVAMFASMMNIMSILALKSIGMVLEMGMMAIESGLMVKYGRLGTAIEESHLKC